MEEEGGFGLWVVSLRGWGLRSSEEESTQTNPAFAQTVVRIRVEKFFFLISTAAVLTSYGSNADKARQENAEKATERV